MKLLIASPCAGGMATTGWIDSMFKLIIHLGNAGHTVEVKMQGKESLINRARNTDATYALTKGFDKVLFIDSDIVFAWEHVKMLLSSKHLIVGGTYPVKNFPITLNFNPLVEHLDLFRMERQQDNYLAWVKKYADKKGEAEVLHLPTGFLLVDCKVFAKLTHVVPWYRDFGPDAKKFEDVHYEFFPTYVAERSETDHTLLSEDWGFMELARQHGFRAYLQTKAVCGHIGSIQYRLGQHEIVTGQTPLINS